MCANSCLYRCMCANSWAEVSKEAFVQIVAQRSVQRYVCKSRGVRGRNQRGFRSNIGPRLTQSGSSQFLVGSGMAVWGLGCMAIVWVQAAWSNGNKMVQFARAGKLRVNMHGLTSEATSQILKSQFKRRRFLAKV